MVRRIGEKRLEWKKVGRKLFCEISPFCYNISLKKEICKRKVKDALSKEKFAEDRSEKELDNIVKGHSSVLIRRLHGVDIRLQENKVTNIRLACGKINGIVVHPGETFSFWRTVGAVSEKLGYKEGLVIKKNSFSSGIGGGLCQMANMIHYLVLNSPLEVTELHHHSDALFPDERRRVPFGTGTSILYNNVDYRFKNTTNQDIQLLTWCEDEEVLAEMRSERPFPYRYKLVEENHHFRMEDGVYYRISQVYRLVIDRETGEQVDKQLVLDNHSKVMYDYSLIPKDQIRNDENEAAKTN